MELARLNASISSRLTGAAAWISRCLESLWRAQRKRKSLVVRETASLGERRCVAVVECERQRFLIGAGPSSITLLAQLPDQLGPPPDLASGEISTGGDR